MAGFCLLDSLSQLASTTLPSSLQDELSSILKTSKQEEATKSRQQAVFSACKDLQKFSDIRSAVTVGDELNNQGIVRRYYIK